MAIFVGGESANSTVKMVSSVSEVDSKTGSPVVDTYINTLTIVDKNDAFNDLDGKFYDNYYEVDGTYYKVGEEAETESQDNSSIDDIERYKLPEYRIETIISIYRQLAKANRFGESVYYVTGVPTRHSNNPEVEKYIVDSLVNSSPHVVNGKSIDIKEVKVIKQGLASYYNDLLNDDSSVNVDFFREIDGKNLLYMDLGWGTTDIQRISNRKPDGDEGFSGVKTIVESVYTDAKNLETKDSAKLTSLSVPLLGFHNVITDGILKASRELSFDMVDSRGKHVENFVNRLIKLVSSSKFKISNIDKVYVCGGGSIGLKEDIKRIFQTHFEYSDEVIEEKFVFVEEAQQSNARGYYKFALKFFPEKLGVKS